MVESLYSLGADFTIPNNKNEVKNNKSNIFRIIILMSTELLFEKINDLLREKTTVNRHSYFQIKYS